MIKLKKTLSQRCTNQKFSMYFLDAVDFGGPLPKSSEIRFTGPESF